MIPAISLGDCGDAHIGELAIAQFKQLTERKQENNLISTKAGDMGTPLFGR